MAHLLLLGSFIVVVFVVYQLTAQWKLQRRLPPGPKPLPIIGNLLDLPPKEIPGYQYWIKHKDLYGPISSLTVLGQTTVFLHDAEAAQHLLGKKALQSSGRPEFEFSSHFCGLGELHSNQQYTPRWRHDRKTIHKLMGTKALSGQFNPDQVGEARRLLVRTLNKTEDLFEHFRFQASSTILKVIYGYSVEPFKPDPLVMVSERLAKGIVDSIVPLTWAVDNFPFLKYLPRKFPGMSWRKRAQQINDETHEAINVPYSFVRNQMAIGKHRPSYVSRLVEGLSQDSNLRAEEETSIKWTAGTMFSASSESTVSTLQSFVLAMVMFPEVQRKAQNELDCVVGTDRLPEITDRDNLPYIKALVSETHRWHPIAPTGLPHIMAQDEFYNGYLIPKGAQICPAVWWFMHDPSVYTDPATFNPERFLDPHNEPDPRQHIFGYGRRTCPGHHFADDQIFLSIAHLLATFSFNKATDDLGREIDVKLESTTGLVTHPAPFQYKAMLRGAKQEELIRNIEKQHSWEESDAERLGNCKFDDYKDNMISVC
ncbi:hypothetical protein CDD81_628 [Ophiocordyceps australis]|uniref:O-methylsterigmatocystin oxidoreductase n=1 Tax=Ophiocordyceps australis TaxID=1399860 RepID=A0A2C5Y1G0_9HYPO|nr:hypothetical protein CDD81_628 [Ophiocordyceps australis]